MVGWASGWCAESGQGYPAVCCGSSRRPWTWSWGEGPPQNNTSGTLEELGAWRCRAAGWELRWMLGGHSKWWTDVWWYRVFSEMKRWPIGQVVERGPGKDEMNVKTCNKCSPRWHSESPLVADTAALRQWQTREIGQSLDPTTPPGWDMGGV